MLYKLFRISLHDLTSGEEELNAFLRSHRVLNVERRFVGEGQNSCWCFCVEYAAERSGQGFRSGAAAKQAVDYREVLSPEEFEVFAGLRRLT